MNFLVKNILDIALKKKLKIATAESCSGGMIAASIIKTSGFSSVFDCGFVVYSNESKNKILGVSSFTLKKYGSISAQVAQEMSLGVIKNSSADIAISCTGLTDSLGIENILPAGLVYIAVLYRNWKEALVCKYHFSGNRIENINQIVNKSIDLINLTIKLI